MEKMVIIPTMGMMGKASCYLHSAAPFPHSHSFHTAKGTFLQARKQRRTRTKVAALSYRSALLPPVCCCPSVPGSREWSEKTSITSTVPDTTWRI